MSNFVPFTSDDEIVSLGNRVLARTLPKPEWTHAAHFSTAIWILVCRPDLDASRAMPGIIRAYNEATGTANTDTSGYHETITQASLRAARAFIAARQACPLFQLCNELMASALAKSDWPLVYWSRERLFSVEARRSWVEPDLQPLPF